ncbi:unnamed protein product [Pseudo-nitzschia multistriata]|uniref:Uncharacterized protein n=1 Tax=Pseudo-nitzschia multistriata TaxID=183589 RepID=A0A448ZCZ1_9STRA|nr:unnamed protein product [Pseudo-nitzschia multistriata]
MSRNASRGNGNNTDDDCDDDKDHRNWNRNRTATMTTTTTRTAKRKAASARRVRYEHANQGARAPFTLAIATTRKASLAVFCILQFALWIGVVDRGVLVADGFGSLFVANHHHHHKTVNSNTLFGGSATDSPQTSRHHFFSRFRNDHVARHHDERICASRTPRLVLWMGQKGGSKGDKQNRKKKATSSGATGASSPQPSSIPVQRVSNQINVPIRRQIRYGKINKQLREAAATGQSFRQTRKGNFVPAGPGTAGNNVKRTSYRKQLDEETIQQKALERQRKGQNPDWSVVLNQTKADPLVLVDGYNVIYKWARLKKHMARGDVQHARELLLEDLEGLASLRRWRIECVFDGAGRGGIAGPLGSGPGNKNDGLGLGKQPTTAPFGKAGTVRTVFTGSGIEADTYIEGRCAAAKNVTLGKTTSSLVVATDDAQIRLVANSAGALCMGSDRFVLELRAVKKSMQYRVEKAMAEVNGVPIRPEKLWGTTVSSVAGGTGSSFQASTTGTAASSDASNRTNKTAAKTDNNTATPQGTKRQSQLRPISAENRIGTAKKEVLEEHADGSKTIKARYGANHIIITDNRNKKPKQRKQHMATGRGGEGEPKRKKKKKKKKK